MPADLHTILNKAEPGEQALINVLYREAIGSLIFLASVSRPDIAYAVNVASKYCSEHNQSLVSCKKNLKIFSRNGELWFTL